LPFPYPDLWLPRIGLGYIQRGDDAPRIVRPVPREEGGEA
jgi:hypothetical protein